MKAALNYSDHYTIYSELDISIEQNIVSKMYWNELCLLNEPRILFEVAFSPAIGRYSNVAFLNTFGT